MKIFGTIHIADILWLILLIVLIFFGIRFSVPREVMAQEGQATVRYTLEFGYGTHASARRMRAGFYENVSIGDAIFDAVRGVHMGHVVDVYAVPFQVAVLDESTNIIRFADVDGLELTRVVVEAVAEISEYETLVNGITIATGLQEVFVRSANFAGDGLIISVEIINWN
ncbi:MAG: DUF4330 family protein [Turicibacter sp.]|nr:DUF4330 family protein [Turicibacter sp.]